MQTVFTTYKLMVLFMLKNADQPLSGSFLVDYILEQENNDYFRLQEAFSALEEDGLIDRNVVGNRTYYQLTEQGGEVLSYMEADLPETVRRNIIDHLREHNSDLRHEVITPVDIYPSGHGSCYTVRCRIIEDDSLLFDLSFEVPGKDAALAAAGSWPMKSQAVYAKIMEELL